MSSERETDNSISTLTNYSYYSIIRDSYCQVDISERPKIFGMTASPVDAKVDIAEAAS